MKVLALRADSGACAKYRLIEPARVVSDQFGVDVRIQSDAAVEAKKDTGTRMVTVSEIQEDIDLLIIQRPLDNAMTSMIQQAKRQGIATIVEIDDDFHNVHPRNIAARTVDPRYYPHSNYQWVSKAADLADLVTVSTPALEKYAPHGRVEVLRNCVPESIFDINHKKPNVITVGWTGTLQTHPDDMDATRGRVGQVMTGKNVAFHVVGDGKGVYGLLGIPTSMPMSDSGWVALENYYDEIARHIHVGIVPLEKSSFNEAKSYLKGLEFAALGIPFVASSTGEYRLLEANGVGKVAKSPGDWNRWLGRWIESKETISETGAQYQAIVRERFTYEGNAKKWYDAWDQATFYGKLNNKPPRKPASGIGWIE